MTENSLSFFTMILTLQQGTWEIVLMLGNLKASLILPMLICQNSAVPNLVPAGIFCPPRLFPMPVEDLFGTKDIGWLKFVTENSYKTNTFLVHKMFYCLFLPAVLFCSKFCLINKKVGHRYVRYMTLLYLLL